jgi:hypothetical protein
MTRPDTAAALAAFLARGGKVTRTAPATAEAQREATIARRKADAAAERAALEAQCARPASPTAYAPEQIAYIDALEARRGR